MTATKLITAEKLSSRVNMRESQQALPTISKSTFSARAIYAGEQIDLRSFVRSRRVLAQQPAIVALKGGGVAIIFRYGAVVFFDVSLAQQQTFLEELVPLVRQTYKQPETEEITISIDEQAPEGIAGEAVVLREASLKRLEIIAAAVGKSVALAQYEADAMQNFERIEPFAVQLEQSGRGGRNMRLLLRHTGSVLLDELKMVARVEVTDRPELIWDHPGLKQLYLRLEDEFELQERASILDRKLELIARTVGTVLDLLQKRRSSRVEWYIVILILIELAVMLYQLFAGAVLSYLVSLLVPDVCGS
jgi:required for meiotic nuclear division protein 1